MVAGGLQKSDSAYSRSIVKISLQFASVCPTCIQSQKMPRIHGVKSGSRVSGRGRALSWATVGHESWRVGSQGVLIAWQERSSRQAPFLLRAFPRPASPVRFRPSLPGVFDPGDEFIGPPNRLVNILEYGQALCEGGVHLIPIPFAWQWLAARPAPACRRKASGRRPSQP